MTSTGKEARKSSGLNRYELHKGSHSSKSPEKRAKMGWGKSGKMTKNNESK